jgi:pimeloyl-ACP methyl ester carboxylesterase
MTAIENSLLMGTLSPTSARRARGNWPWTVLRIASGTLGVLALVAATGAAYEAIASASDATVYPPAGRLVDVGGYKLHLDCRGEGSPTVVLDAGLSASSVDWALVQPELAHATRVCSYDRAGMGWSEPGPGPRSPRHIADELHLLLENGNVAGPYVLVGHSLAGKNIRMFANAYPSEVAGLVLVDARSEMVESPADIESFARALEGQATQYSLARRFGIARLFGSGLVGEPLVPAALATEMVLAQTQPNAIAETTAEGLARSADDEALSTTSLGSMPLVVVAAGESMRNLPNWPEAQRAMAKLSTKGKLIVAETSHHGVHIAQPHIVLNAINDVIADVRSGS